MVKKKSSLRSKLKWLILPIILGGLAYLVFYSPVFAITKIDVVGSGVTPDDIVKYLGAGTVGSNILFWQPATDIDALKPPIFTLRKNYFNRTITLNVIERDKALVWCYEKNKNCFWVDQNGVIFQNAPDTSGNLIKVVDDYTDRSGNIGDTILPADFTANFMRILTVIDKLNLSIQEIRLENLNYRELIVLLNSGPKIIFSLELDPAFTEAGIKEYKDSSSWSRIKSINLTVDGRAYASF